MLRIVQSCGIALALLLPVQAQATHGGQNGLPKQARGYYHGYAVKAPGARGRGAQRIISGEVNEYYYAADHYQTFNRIRE